MTLTLNGEKRITVSKTVYELLQELDIMEQTMAVAINMEVVKKENWEKHELQNEDKVELLKFVGGG